MSTRPSIFFVIAMHEFRFVRGTQRESDPVYFPNFEECYLDDNIYLIINENIKLIPKGIVMSVETKSPLQTDS